MQIVGLFTGVASGIHPGLAARISRIWRREPHRDAQLPPAAPEPAAPVAAAVPDGSPSTKRPRLGTTPQPNGTTRSIRANTRRGGRQSSSGANLNASFDPIFGPKQLPYKPPPQIVPPHNIDEQPSAKPVEFNHAGHFSADYVVDSDSDDGDTPMSDAPVIGCTPDPIVLDQPETILDTELTTDVAVGQFPQSSSKGPTPIALNQPEAILAVGPLDTTPVGNNTYSSSPLPSSTTAAVRAINMISTSSRRNFSVPRLPLATPATPPAPTAPAKPDAENARDVPKKSDEAKAALVFFEEDYKFSLPGLEGDGMTLDDEKEKQIKRIAREKLRAQQDKEENERLGKLGLRRPKATLIPETSQHWAARASAATINGKFDPSSVHPAAVKLEARDFAKLVPETAWLNDDCVHSTLCCLSAYINKKAGVQKQDAPKCVAMSSLNWTTFCGDHRKLYPRLFKRQWNMTPENFHQVDTVLIPVNSGNHWTLLTIRPSRRSISYLDSYNGRSERHLNQAREWIRTFLGANYKADDWKIEHVPAPRQNNAWDCGMFVITNAMCVALGLDPMCYDEGRMPTQRRRVAAMLLNGGFSGDFDLGHL